MLKIISIDEFKEMLTEINLPYQLWIWKEDESKGWTSKTYPRCVVLPTNLTSEYVDSEEEVIKFIQLEVNIVSNHSLEPKVLELEQKLIDNDYENNITQQYFPEDEVFIYTFDLEVKR